MKKIIIVAFALILGLNSFGQSVSHQEIDKSIDDLFENYSSYNRFIGNVLISQNDTIIYQKSFGYADIENHKKNTENSIFSIASATKPLTAVGIMTLVENGKLSLDTPIITYFPNFIPDFSKDITIRHLLNHSSGMQANIGRIDNEGNGLVIGEHPTTREELFAIFKDSELKFEPGKGYEYNNFGYTLLAYIIEKVSGQSYADYMEQAVFIPAHMKNTAVDSYKSSSEISYPHIGLGMSAFVKHSNSIHSSWIKGAGDVNSTIGDLFSFMEALDKGTLLKSSSVDKLYNLRQSIGINDSEYGLGWKIEYKGGEEWINHTGLLPGVTSVIGALPERNIKIIILSNATSTDLSSEGTFQGKGQFVNDEIVNKVIATLQGKPIELMPIPTTVHDDNMADFSNTYQLDHKHSLMLHKEGEDYYLESIGSDSWSVFTYLFSRDVKKDDKASEIATYFANAMSTQNFEGLADYGNNDMKAYFGSEEGIQQLKGIWSYFLEEAGEFRSYNMYKMEGEANKEVYIRFHFVNNDIGIFLGINSDNLIQGMFKDDAVKTSHISKVKLIPVGENKFFINGHQHGGMQDLKVNISDTELVLIDGSNSFNGKQSVE